MEGWNIGMMEGVKCIYPKWKPIFHKSVSMQKKEISWAS